MSTRGGGGQNWVKFGLLSCWMTHCHPRICPYIQREASHATVSRAVALSLIVFDKTTIPSKLSHLNFLIRMLYCENIYIRGFTKFGIKVAWSLQFLEYLKASTKIEVFLALPCWLSQLNWDSQQDRLRTRNFNFGPSLLKGEMHKKAY